MAGPSTLGSEPRRVELAFQDDPTILNVHAGSRGFAFNLSVTLVP